MINNFMFLFRTFRHHATCFTVLNLLLFTSQIAQFKARKSLNLLYQLPFLNGLYQTVQPPATTNKPPRTTHHHPTPATAIPKKLHNSQQIPTKPIKPSTKAHYQPEKIHNNPQSLTTTIKPFPTTHNH